MDQHGERDERDRICTERRECGDRRGTGDEAKDCRSTDQGAILTGIVAPLACGLRE
jgi:hypothetical protein